MSADEAGGDEEYHEFSESELDKILYFWDESTRPVHEYHYMKLEWRKRQDQDPEEESNNLRKKTHDDGHRTIVALNEYEARNEHPVFLELDCDWSAHVVEFYASWCPHCRVMKPHYVELAREVTRRSIGTQVYFHAVSCDLYPEICQTYGIDGFPSVLGYAIGDSIEEQGSVLNQPGVRMTPETIATTLDLTLAHEAKVVTSRTFTDSQDERAYLSKLQVQAEVATRKKKSWHEFQSTLNERFHNAAVSLAFVLKTGVHVKRDSQLDHRRIDALRHVLELIDWAAPRRWDVRTGLVNDLLCDFNAVTTDPDVLSDTVERHMSIQVPNGLWGDIEPSRRGRRNVPKGEVADNEDDMIWRNAQWSEACTHSQRGMGYTCGLWDLFHILTIGVSLPEHQLYGFHSGYDTSQQHVGSVIKRFVEQFLACDVCRRNFIDMYDNCGHDHCMRLTSEQSILERKGDKQNGELAMWLWQVHNSVNVRLMKEAAERSDREMTESERLSAFFPTKDMCPDCWLDDALELHDADAILDFLKRWYWPSEQSTKGVSFRSRVVMRDDKEASGGIITVALIPVAIVLMALASRLFRRAAVATKGKDI